MRSGLRVLPFLWGSLVCAILFVAVYLIFVRTRIGQVIDERAFAGADAWKSGVIQLAHAFLDWLPIASVAVGAVIALIMLAVRRNWLVFTIAVGAATAANVSTQVLKYTILSRPDKGVDAGLANSLPSGHTSVAASAALVVFLLASPRLRPLSAVLGAVFTIVAGVSTLVEQWHRPSDVVAGMLVVAFWGCIAGMVIAGLRLPSADPPVRSKLWLLLWIGLSCAAGSMVSLLVTYFSAQSGGVHLLTAYAGGIGAIAAAGCVLATLGNRLFSGLA